MRYVRFPPPEGSARISKGYWATPEGHIWSGFNGRHLKAGMGTNGRLGVHIRLDGDARRKTIGVHVLICSAFHGPRPDAHDVSHLNGDKLDNRSENLAWETVRKNMARKYEHGTDDMGVKNTRACLDNKALEDVFRSAAAGETHKSIALRHGCHRLTITKVLNGWRYRNFYENQQYTKFPKVGEQRWTAKLTERQVLDARISHANGERSVRSMALELGVSPSTMRQAVLGITWKHLNERKDDGQN